MMMVMASLFGVYSVGMSDDVLTPGGQVKAIGEGVEHATTGISKLVTSISEAVRSGNGTRGKRAIFRKSVRDVRRLFGDDVLSKVEEHALACEYVRTVNGFENLNAVGCKTEDACRAGNVDMSGIDRILPDWWDAFMEGVFHAYNENVQNMWADLLTGEIDSPGSFSKRALRTLTDMSADEAELFRYLCSWSVEWRTEDRDRWRPLPLLATRTDNLGDGTVYANGPWHRELAPLEHASLTSQANGDVYAGDIAFESPLHVRYRPQGKWVELTLKPTNASSRFGSGYAFTAVGVELSALCDSDLGSADGLEELATEYAEMGGYEIVRRGDGEPDSD